MAPREYRGPAATFPYDTYHALGLVQLILGICILILGLVHVSLSYEDRRIFLLSGSAVIWCPLLPISAGIVGLLLCKKRYWEVECLNTAFIILSGFAAAVMIVLILVTIFLEFYYYGVIDLEPVEIFGYVGRRLSGQNKEGYTAMVCLVLVFAALELIFALASSLAGCCCAPIYEPDHGQQFQIIKKPIALDEPAQPRPQIHVPKHKFQPVQSAQSVVIDENQLQPVQLVYQEQPPPVQYVETAPSLLYLPPPSTLLRY